MGIGKGSAPTPPNPAAVAAAQSQANRATALTQAQLNMIGQVTPYGNLSYNQTGTGPDGTPLYTATTSLSPGQQQLFDTRQANQQGIAGLASGQIGQVQQALARPLDFSGLPSLTNDYGADRTRIEGALYDRMSPQLEQRRRAVETQLANQGIVMGSEAWRQGMDDLNRGENDARLGVVGQGGAEQARLYQMAMGGRQQGINEQVLQRQTPLNELQALMGGSQVQMPQFQRTPNTGVANTDVAGIYNNNYNQQMAAYNSQNQMAGAGLGGLFQLGGSLISGGFF